MSEALTSVRAWAAALPLTTAATIVAAVAAHAARVLARVSVGALCLAPLRDPFRRGAWRLVTAPLTHVGVLHLAFNVWAYAPTASGREAAVGSAAFGVELSALTLVAGLLFWGGAAAAWVVGTPWFAVACTAGASGVIFALMQADAAGPNPPPPVALSASLSIPARLYPSCLAVAIQLLLPGVSAAGHAAGLAAGEVAGALRRRSPHALAAAGAAVDAWVPAAVKNASAWVSPVGHAGLPVSAGDAASPTALRFAGDGLAARVAGLIASLRGGGGSGGPEYEPLASGEPANPFAGAGGGGGSGHVLGGGAPPPAAPPAEAAAAAAAARAAAAGG